MTDPDRPRRRFLAISLVFLLPLVAGVLLNAARSSDDEPDADSLYKYLAVFSETLNLVRQNYVESTDIGQLLAGAMEGSTDALDPYSIFLPSTVSVAEEPDVIPGARHAGLVVLKDRGVAYLAAVEAGSSAESAGLESGDILSTVAGHPTRQMPVWAINHELVSAAGKSVEVEIVRSGETKKMALTVESGAAPSPKIEETGGFPMLSLPRIDISAVEPARALLGTVATPADGKPAKLIVDLRGVSGGSPDAAYALAGLFAQGNLGELKEKERSLKSFANAAAPTYRGETVVLVNGFTAGAAEILAAALRQSGGAKLIGTPSFGWAGERSRLELSNGARLLVTTAYFSAVDGKPLREALAPDLLVDEFGLRFEERDRPLSQLILERALRFLAGEAELDEKKAA